MLKINEIFGPTIQGEGKSSGLEVTFIRTSLCNLHCVWCDTPYTWNWKDTNFEHVNNVKYDKRNEVHLMTEGEILDRVYAIGIKNIVLSGGEPLLQQKQLLPLLKSLKKSGYWIEVETNGAVMPSMDFLEVIDQVNCSPKLANSNNSRRLRERKDVLTALAQSPKVNFKFVVSSAIADVQEIIHLTETYKMKEVYIMPLGMIETELLETRDYAKNLSQIYGFHYTDRLHITLLGGGRGV